MPDSSRCCRAPAVECPRDPGRPSHQCPGRPCRAGAPPQSVAPPPSGTDSCCIASRRASSGSPSRTGGLRWPETTAGAYLEHRRRRREDLDLVVCPHDRREHVVLGQRDADGHDAVFAGPDVAGDVERGAVHGLSEIGCEILRCRVPGVVASLRGDGLRCRECRGIRVRDQVTLGVEGGPEVLRSPSVRVDIGRRQTRRSPWSATGRMGC